MSKEWIKESVSFKLIIVAILVLLLLIPMQMIKNLIRDREFTNTEVINEISALWANEQTINGPIISVPYKIPIKDEDVIKYLTKHLHFLPDELNINGDIQPEIRYRGIHKSVVYTGNLNINGNFNSLDASNFDIDPNLVLWNKAFVSFGVSDMRGISQELKIKVNNKNYMVEPGTRTNDIIDSGVSFNLDLSELKPQYNFNFDLVLRGSKALNFIPVGKTTNVNINSPWDAPSFNGAFIPNNRKINKDGFEADWQVLHLNRNFPQKWTGKKHNLSTTSYGVDFILPVNQYQKSERAAKYAIMFIGLTFIVFFFTEVLSKKRMHPIQYLLVGFGIVIFYTLLLGLAEHLSFNLSFLIGSTSVISLITYYTKATLNKRKTTLSILGLLVALYAFLYTILQLEAYSLLMGSIGLFIALTLIMILSRKVDWNNPGIIEKKAKEEI